LAARCGSFSLLGDVFLPHLERRPDGSARSQGGRIGASGCSAAWIAHLTGGQGVGSSNLPSPTEEAHLRIDMCEIPLSSSRLKANTTGVDTPPEVAGGGRPEERARVDHRHGALDSRAPADPGPTGGQRPIPTPPSAVLLRDRICPACPRSTHMHDASSFAGMGGDGAGGRNRDLADCLGPGDEGHARAGPGRGNRHALERVSPTAQESPSPRGVPRDQVLSGGG
jgi:hypothetical protein